MGIQAPLPLRPALRAGPGRRLGRWSSPARKRSSASISRAACELVYQGQPTGTATEVSGEDIEDSISIIEQRINKLGVSESEVARLGNDEITVSLPGITDANRAAEQVGHHRAALLLRLGAEPDRPREGDRRPSRASSRRQAPLKASEKRWKEAGRNAEEHREPAADRRRRLPDRLRGGAAGRRTGTRHRSARTARSPRPRYYLFEKDAAAQTARRAGADEEGPLRQPDREEAAEGRDRGRSPGRHDPRLRIPDRRIRQARRDRPARLVRAAATTRRSRATTSPNRSRNTGQNSEPNVTFNFTDKGREAFQEVTRQIAQRGQAQAIGPVSAERSGGALRPLRGRPRQRSPDPADHQLRRKPGRDRRPRTAPRSPAASRTSGRGAGTGDDAADRRPADQPAS